jgi:hypothetical protein
MIQSPAGSLANRIRPSATQSSKLSRPLQKTEIHRTSIETILRALMPIWSNGSSGLFACVTLAINGRYTPPRPISCVRTALSRLKRFYVSRRKEIFSHVEPR